MQELRVWALEKDYLTPPLSNSSKLLNLPRLPFPYLYNQRNDNINNGIYLTGLF